MGNRDIKVYKDLMGENSLWAEKIRNLLTEKKVMMVNIIGSPGCGKTSLLEKIASTYADKKDFAVLEGDVETTHDAERLDALDVPVSQLLTSGACHLEAKMVYQALSDLSLDTLNLVIVENVGNLVCPAEFDIGEYAKIAVLSVTEGEDKPVKYPLLFREAKAVVLTKTDLLPHLPFKKDVCLDYMRKVNSTVPIFEVSSVTGAGISSFVDWITSLG
ncbi:MAG: hydrogenase nickel incorporation protein HypB [Spirochaetales bacterium]|nr:hydrogenase nickel incorporation protein HypB [Spirochaetales bacterium]